MSRFVLTAQLQLQAPTNVAQVVRQIQSQLNSVNVNVQVQNVGQAQRQLNNITTACNNAGTAADRMGRAFGTSIRRFAAFGIATRAVSLFTSTLSSAIKEAIAFEQELVKVIQVSGATRAELSDLVNTVTRLSTSLGVSSRDVLQAGKVLVQAGVSFDDARIALDALAKSALAPNFDNLSETTEGAVAILAQFQQGVGALEGQLSSVNAVAGAFAVEAGDLIDVVRRAGGIFKSSGGSLNELLALFTSVRATTRESAESIGTGLRTIFTRIQRPKTIEFLKQFGVQLTDLQGRFVGPFEAVRRLSDALAGLGEGDITFIRIAEELGGFRQIGKVLPLLQQFQTAQEALNVAQNAGTGLTRDALTAQQALAVRITKVKEEFLALARSVTETSTFQVFANTALNLASALIKLADALKPIIPLLTVVAGIRLARGFGNFAGGILGGLGSARTFNKGGKVHQFARGGMVPGTGNRDTVPAMLTPGEFVIRKSSVNKLGASNLAAMNENKYAEGGLIDRIATGKKEVGAALLENRSLVPGSFSISKKQIEKRSGLKLNEKFPQLGVFSAPREGLNKKTYNSFSQALDNSIVDAANQTSAIVANDLGLSVKQITGSTKSEFLSSINTATRGNLFEDTLSVLSGGPFTQEPGRPFDFPRGLTNVLKDNYSNLPNAFIDAKASLSAASLSGKGSLFEKTIRQISDELKLPENLKLYTSNIPQKGGETIERLSTNLQNRLNFLRGKSKLTKSEQEEIQKLQTRERQRLANGGIAKAPLVDDILQASGSILPRPSAAIQSLIKAGGGAVDIDRTLKRTVGDIAYAKAPTIAAKQAALDTYFRDETRRLQDIKSAPLTQFGKELQAAVKSGQINPNRLSIISKSRRVRGVAQYLSGLFGIPTSNMIFTQGGSKEPALSALRTKGPRSNRVPFATGGGVGSDSVPALLTPGEFVVNRKAAQNIGYGNLNRMNKVGRYANGGIVQTFARGGRASNDNSNAALALTLIPATIQSFLPSIDESSTALRKLTDSVLNTVTTLGSVAFALQAFNVQLSTNNLRNIFGSGAGGLGATINQNLSRAFNQSTNYLGNFGRALRATTQATARGGSGSAVMQTLAGRGVTGLGASAGGGLGRLLGPVSKALGSVVSKISGPLLGLTIVNTIVGSFRDLDGQLKDAIKAQDTAKAQTLAISKANADAIPLIGSLVGGIADAVGGADSLAGFLTIFGGDTANSIKSTIAAQIATAKANESLKKASEESAKTMEELQNGTITASQGLQRVAALTADAEAARQANIQAITAKSEDRAAEGTFTTRNIFTLGGLLGETGGQRNRRITQEQEKLADENIRLQKESLTAQRPLIQATARSTFARGGNLDQAKAAVEAAGGITPETLQKQIDDLSKRAEQAQLSGDTQTANLLLKQQNALGKQAEQLEKEFQNIEKEIKRSQAAFAAMNLGLQGVTAAANAGVVGLNNYLAAQEFGNNAASNAIAILEASITSAAQGISATDFNNALKTSTDALRNLGASRDQITQVENNIRAVNTAQKRFPSALSSLQKTFEEQAKAGLRPDASPENQKELIGRILDQQLSDAGISDEARKSFKAQFDNLKLDPDAINKLLAGDVSVLEGPLKEIGEAALNQLLPILKAQAEAQDTLNKVLKSKIELENKLVSAQRQRLDIELEAAEIAAKYGGPAVTPEIRRQNVIAQANIQSRRDLRAAGNLQQGTAAEFNQRNTRIRDRLQEIADIRTQAAGTGIGAQAARNRLEGASGVRLEAEQQRLQELAKSDFETTKQLIKLKEDELQLIKEKNKLEQDSIQSLISGDIEKFFEQQAAVGATAAIATGNESLMRAFGASALGAAAQDIQRQQQAGVQTLFGQQLGGAGGLTERAFGAAIGARGVQDPRLAAIAAGTTAEEVSLQKDIVDLAGTLTNYGDILVQSAQGELEAANLQFKAAEKQLEAATQRVKNQQAQAKNAPPLPLAEAAPKRLGGLIYASTGKFINFKPRGTDIVPAMLTPGEFVVRREAVQRGNNLSILKAMNRGQSNAQTTSNGGVASMASGGVVRYRANGSDGPESASGFGSFIEKLANFGNALINFNQRFSENIDRLNSTTFNVKLDASNININLTGTSFVGKLKEDLQQELFAEIGRRLGNTQISQDGTLKQGTSVLG